MKSLILAVIAALAACSKTNTQTTMMPLPASRLYLEAHLPDGAKQLQPESISKGIFAGATRRIYSNPSKSGIEWGEEIIERDGDVLMYSQRIPLNFFQFAASPQQVVQSFASIIGATYFVTHKDVDKAPDANSPEAKIYPKFVDFARDEFPRVVSGESSSRIIGDSGMRVRAAPGCIMVDILAEPSYVALKASEVDISVK